MGNNLKTTEAIREDIDSNFTKYYKAFSSFIKEPGIIRDKCFEAIGDPELLSHFIFANDYLKVPPAVSFVAYYGEDIPPFIKGQDDYLKKGLGAFWGYVFRYILLYDNAESTWVVPMNNKNIKTASIFTGGKRGVKVVK
jgi:hypothetical protein